MTCPHCGVDDVRECDTTCPDPDGYPDETLSFSVCANCDYGINEHTEGVCDCAA